VTLARLCVDKFNSLNFELYGRDKGMAQMLGSLKSSKVETSLVDGRYEDEASRAIHKYAEDDS
jgi:hypothetical protein